MAAHKSSRSARLSKAVVEGLPAPSCAWDRDLTGFGVRVSPKGARAYFVHQRDPAGRQIAITIGRHGGPWTAEQARTRAKQLLGEIASGTDPAATRRNRRQAERERRAAPTVKELLDCYLTEHAERRKRPSSVRTDRCLIDKHLRAIALVKVADITPSDVEGWHAKISVKAPIAANRALAVLSKAMSLAIKRSWRADNPCRGIERNPENRRERYLTPPELGRLRDALNRRQGDPAAACIAFLLVTGARRGETLAARWGDFDLTTGVWLKPAANTKQKKSHRVPLNAAAVAILAGLAQAAPNPDAHVFGPELMHRLRSVWEAVRDEAGLPGLRLHDLRHAYASVLVSAGLSLPIIGALLGHTAPATTARYAHLLDSPLRAATEHVGALWQGSDA
jgi:integrase